MKMTRAFIAFLITITGLSVASVSATPTVDTPRAERTLEQKIFKEINTLPRYGVFDLISFEVRGSTVVLGGKTISLGTRGQAARVVKQIPGVTEVINNIEELPLSSLDNEIRARTLRRFAEHGLYRYLWEPNPSVRIIVEHGRVSLEGYVANSGDRNMMNILANGIPGVFGVENNLVVGTDKRYR
jgi:hyperosmotically inducible periplasmic protein